MHHNLDGFCLGFAMLIAGLWLMVRCIKAGGIPRPMVFLDRETDGETRAN